MGRLHTPKKPTVWNPDSFQVAIAAVRKYSQPIPADVNPFLRHIEAPRPGSKWYPQPPSVFAWKRPPSQVGKRIRQPSNIVDLAPHLEELDFRLNLPTILSKNSEARTGFEEFYDSSQGSRLRPFDLDAFIEECLEKLAEVGNEERD